MDILEGFYASSSCPKFSDSFLVNKWRKFHSTVEAASLNPGPAVISSHNEDVNLKSLLLRTGLSCFKMKKKSNNY